LDAAEVAELWGVIGALEGFAIQKDNYILPAVQTAK
jgi:hypothetical protein